MKFYYWLRMQVVRDDHVSEVGKFILKYMQDFNQPYFAPSQVVTAIKNKLDELKAPEECYCALWESYVEYARRGRKSKREPIPPKLRFEVFSRDDYRCQICGVMAASGIRLEVDHKVPVIEGGRSISDNLWVLCFPCNRGKGKRPLAPMTHMNIN